MGFSSNKIAVACTAGIAVVAVVGVSAVGVASEHKETIIEADGLTMSVSGFNRDVEDAVMAAQVEIGEHDVVTPALGEALEPDQTVRIDRAELYRVDGRPDWSAAQTLVDVLEDTEADRLTVSRLRETVPVAENPLTASLVVDGEEQPVEVAPGETVPEVLEGAGIEVGPLDAVSLVADNEAPQLEVVTQSRGVAVNVVEVPFEEERRENPELLVGTEQVAQEGVAGERTIKTYRQLRGGEVIAEVQIADAVTTAPVAKIIEVGTREPVQVTATAPVTEQTGGGGGDFSGDPWAALAQCESGGNPSTNTGNGYYGMYQFTQQTWESVGGSGLPSDASAAEQTARAQALQQRSGWGQWPGCTSSLGLR